MSGLKKYFIPACLILPMISHWILPWGIEFKLYLHIFGAYLYLPDFLYIIYLLSFVKNKRAPRLQLNRSLSIIFICFAIIIYTYTTNLLKGIGNTGWLIINNLSIVWLTLIFILFPLDKRQIEATKPLMLAALLILVVQVILYSLGILNYTTTDNHTLKGQDFGGIMRISTTIGAATGTAIVIGLLGAICVTVYSWTQKWLIALFVLTSLGVFFTMSRGTSLIWGCFCIYYFYIYKLRHLGFTKKIKSILLITFAVGIFYGLGGFDPIINRTQHMEKSGDFSAGRENKSRISNRMIDESAPWGYGLGQVLPEKACEIDKLAPYHYAPHNMYYLICIELGWPGLLLFVLLFITLITGMYLKLPLSIYIIMVLLVNGNTETVLLDSEFSALLLFAIMSCTKYNERRLKLSAVTH